MSTTDKVWTYMLDYQRENGMPPKMDEIVAAVDGLNWRSSAQYVLRNLMEDGRVRATDDANCSRRHRAVHRSDRLTPMPDNPLGVTCAMIPSVRVED